MGQSDCQNPNSSICKSKKLPKSSMCKSGPFPMISVVLVVKSGEKLRLVPASKHARFLFFFTFYYIARKTNIQCISEDDVFQILQTYSHYLRNHFYLSITIFTTVCFHRLSCQAFEVYFILFHCVVFILFVLCSSY